jgi:hypothetical protein
MDSFELEWGHGMFTEGKEYIVETRKGFYKGTYKKPEMAIPYVILYNVKKDDIKMAQVKGNVISSTQVADARIEYRTNTQVDQSAIASMMNRLFYSILPF